MCGQTKYNHLFCPLKFIKRIHHFQKISPICVKDRSEKPGILPKFLGRMRTCNEEPAPAHAVPNSLGTACAGERPKKEINLPQIYSTKKADSFEPALVLFLVPYFFVTLMISMSKIKVAFGGIVPRPASP